MHVSTRGSFDLLQGVAPSVRMHVLLIESMYLQQGSIRQLT